ncbi:MAG: EpsI family protein [Candidatus Tectimicrobiota bacterium]|nr:MAG: EpsI family protein [Candidatus Tectomicrobia bacterium]
MGITRRAFLASGLLVAAGLGMRSLSHGEAVPLRQTFATFPLYIGDWQGKELGLDPEVLDKLRVTDYMMRQYQRPQGPPIGLYVGYYASQRQGATYHSPKNCLPGSGWSFLKKDKVRLEVRDAHGRPVEINRFVIQKGLDRQLVLYWYQDRGRILTSEYWAKVYMVLDAIFRNRTDGAFVRVTVPFAGDGEAEAFRHGKAFAEAIFPLLQAYLPG